MASRSVFILSYREPRTAANISFAPTFHLNPSENLWIHNYFLSTLVSVSYPCHIMSSLRNSLHRRNHKERSQLAHRERFGILEKHKDYVLRARDYHSKQDRLTRLRQKATERNKDEFYFGMNGKRTEVSSSISFSFAFQLLNIGWVSFFSIARSTCAGQGECCSSCGYGQSAEESG